MVFISASNQLGAFESGTAAALLGAAPAVVAGALLTVLLAAVWPRFFPRSPYRPARGAATASEPARQRPCRSSQPSLPPRPGELIRALAQTLPVWAELVAPVCERVAKTLAEGPGSRSSGYQLRSRGRITRGLEVRCVSARCLTFGSEL